MPLTVLSDTDVREVLSSLARDDVLALHRSLADALHSYSTVTEPEDSGCCASNQPSRMSLKGKDGVTTLFMPATSDIGMGCKIVSLADSNRADQPLSSESYSPTTIVSSSSPSSPSSTVNADDPSRKSSASSSSAPDDPRTAPVLDPSAPIPTQRADADASTCPRGSITLLSPSGQPRAFLNATTLTAFRTALASTLLLKPRATVHTLTVFGAGQQAFWHIYLALLLRGPEIHRLHVVNRDFARAQRLYLQLAQHPNEAVADVFLGGKLKPTLLTPEYGEYKRLLKEHVRAADVIFCCTPSTTPLFPATHLTSTEGRRKGRYVAAIGSYAPHMQELPAELLQQAVAGPATAEKQQQQHHGIHLHHRHAHEGGAVVVDTIEGAMREAGEVIRSGVRGQGLVELGELVMLKRSHWAERAERERQERERRDGESEHDVATTKQPPPGHERKGSEEKAAEKHRSGYGLGHLFHRNKEAKKGEKVKEMEMHDGGLHDWLSKGNVVYKSVGIGLMDVVVGMEVVRLAEERGIGTILPEF